MILELLKDVSDSVIVGTGEYSSGYMLRGLMSETNEMLVKDELTGIYNRRFVEDRLPADIASASISDMPFSVLFADLDNLKAINDTYGHAFGDIALKSASAEFSRSIRSNDWVARYGGDEFLIFLSNADSEMACTIAKRIGENIKKITILLPDGDMHLGVSVGVVTARGAGLNAQELIALADKQMYEAKRSGKNKLSSYEVAIRENDT